MFNQQIYEMPAPAPRSKKRTKPVGRTASAAIPAVSPAAIPRRDRVIIERPAIEPVRRTCPYCRAVFDDYTGKPNTTYCRASCRAAMSAYKKAEAIKLLAMLTKAPVDVNALIVEGQGLPAAEKLLAGFGYHWQVESKSWIEGMR